MRLLRWLGLGLLGLAGLAVLAAGVVWVWGGTIVGRRYPVTREAVPVASGPEAVARGARLARALGCQGCHGTDLRGHLFFQDPLEPPVYAANLTLKARKYSDMDLARIVRRGVLPDGRGVNAMPSQGYIALSDPDMADLIAFIRSKPAGGVDYPAPQLWLLGRYARLSGKFKLAGEEAQERLQMAPVDLGPQFARGRYLARVVCSECHQPDLKGQADKGPHMPPDLAIAGAYEKDDFMRLLQTGKAAGNREVGLMSEVARGRFAYLTDEDREALYAYLKARAETR